MNNENTRLTDEELKEKERLMRTKVPGEIIRHGFGGVLGDALAGGPRRFAIKSFVGRS